MKSGSNVKYLSQCEKLLKEINAEYEAHVAAHGVPNDKCCLPPHVDNSIFIKVALLKRINKLVKKLA